MCTDFRVIRIQYGVIFQFGKIHAYIFDVQIFLIFDFTCQKSLFSVDYIKRVLEVMFTSVFAHASLFRVTFIPVSL